MPLITPDCLLAPALFALALTGRSLCNLGFIERPVVLGFLWGLCTGEYSVSLPLAVFFELFWIDLFAIGSYLPPMAAFPYLLLMAFARSQSWHTPELLVFPLLLSLPLAYIQPRIEAALRLLQNGAYMRLMERTRLFSPLGGLPGRLVAVSALRQLCCGLAAFVFALGVAATVLMLAAPWAVPPLKAGWPLLYGIAALGALMSLRIRKAHSIFAGCIFCIMLIKLL